MSLTTLTAGSLSSLQASILSLITTAASIAVGFGVFGHTTEQLVVSIAGTVIAAAFQVISAIERKTLIQAKAVKTK